MLSLSHACFRYEPYPIGVAEPVFAPEIYEAMLDAFPPAGLFRYKPEFGHKYSLSEKNNPDVYARYIRETPVWQAFHGFVKSEAFLDRVLEGLRAHYLELGLARKRVQRDGFIGRLRGTRKLRARFEFSMLPAQGGAVRPHTDAPNKFVTLVISMVRAGEWDAALGGGTAILRTRRPQDSFNWVNRSLDFEDVETIEELPFAPNQAVIFIKTFNSWHGVRPMQGGDADVMRRTLTVNIEEA